jgi:hypothetical protein
MQANIERCCGLDVHQGTVVACLLIGAPRQKGENGLFPCLRSHRALFSASYLD